MISLQDCLDMSGLTEDEVHILAEHENVPEIVAMELGASLLQRPGGCGFLRSCIQECLTRAEHAGRWNKARHISEVLHRFDAVHSGGPAP